MNEEWREAFERQAASVWTDAGLAELLHGKELAVTPANAATLLRALGLLRGDATMPPPERRKFFQLNHMLRLMRPPLEELASTDNAPLRIVDAGCGRSYLTLAIAWWLKTNFGLDAAQILGVDRNARLIDDSRRRAEMIGLANVQFVAAELETVTDEPDVVIALHACDTATDDAIAMGLRSEARLIAVAPCCQAELAGRWSELSNSGVNGPFAEIWSTPHLRREIAASMTDTFRKLLLEAAGYETRAVEFVAPEHTPKNTLIRAIKRTGWNGDAWARYEALRDHTGGVGIALSAALGHSDFA